MLSVSVTSFPFATELKNKKKTSPNETQFTHLSIFTEPGEHDNSPTLPLMDHLPEVSACGLHGTLGYDESLLLLVALYINQGRCVQLPLTPAAQTLCW